jgi:hypothetical protein
VGVVPSSIQNTENKLVASFASMVVVIDVWGRTAGGPNEKVFGSVPVFRFCRSPEKIILRKEAISLEGEYQQPLNFKRKSNPESS